MIRKEPTSVQLSYGIPYRRGTAKVEFCLFVFPDHRDWEFPQSFEAAGPDDEKSASLLTPCLEAGFDCRIDDEPLGHFEATRGDVSETVTTYLVEVTNSDAAGGGHPRHRWCLLEEAKLRIRRKPLRHLLDVAQRRLAQNG